MELRRGIMARSAARLILAILPLGAQAALAAPAAPSASARLVTEDSRLDEIFADDARREDLVDPLAALYRGKPVDPGSLSLIFTPRLDRRQLDSARQSLRALRRIERARLTPERQLSYDVFARDRKSVV